MVSFGLFMIFSCHIAVKESAAIKQLCGSSPVDSLTMVWTRSKTKARLREKAHRLMLKLQAMGMLKASLVAFRFGAAQRKLLTRCYVDWCLLNPTSIWFRAMSEDGDLGPILLVGCIHPLTERCQACDVDPDADVKDDTIFTLHRSWHICRLWNNDPFVNET
jgi:hypothetical protein